MILRGTLMAVKPMSLMRQALSTSIGGRVVKANWASTHAPCNMLRDRMPERTSALVLGVSLADGAGQLQLPRSGREFQETLAIYDHHGAS